MEPAQLVRRCVEIVRTYDPAVATVDVHAAAFLDARKIAAVARAAKAAKAAASAAETAAITHRSGDAAPSSPPQQQPQQQQQQQRAAAASPSRSPQPTPPGSPSQSPLARLVAQGTNTSGAAAAALAVASRDADDIFVQQVFYGVQRQARALRAFLNALYHLHSATLVRSDFTLFLVLSYLVLFRLPEMGMRRLGLLLDAVDAAKAYTLVAFAFDRATLDQWVVEQWAKFLDRSFVEELLDALDQQRPGAMVWLESRYTKAFGHSQLVSAGAGAGAGAGTGTSGAALDSTASSGAAGGKPPPPPGVTALPRKAPTVAVAPNITRPKPRFAPEPQRIAQFVRALPVPEWIEATTLEEIEQRNEALRRENAERTRAKYDFEKTVPRLHATRNTVDALRAEVEAQRARVSAPVAPARPPPPLPAAGADVKLNAAAILREDAALTAKHAKEAAVIREFEGNLRDTTEYFAWQEKMRREDEEARLSAVAMRKREAAEAAHAAKAAEAVLAAQSRAIVQEMRRAGEVVSAHLALDRAEEVKTRRAVAEQVKEVEYVAPALARARDAAARRVQHDRVREASLAAEAALERARARAGRAHRAAAPHPRARARALGAGQDLRPEQHIGRRPAGRDEPRRAQRPACLAAALAAGRGGGATARHPARQARARGAYARAR